MKEVKTKELSGGANTGNIMIATSRTVTMQLQYTVFVSCHVNNLALYRSYQLRQPSLYQTCLL